jgi:hypothetical protein
MGMARVTVPVMEVISTAAMATNYKASSFGN